MSSSLRATASTMYRRALIFGAHRRCLPSMQLATRPLCTGRKPSGRFSDEIEDVTRAGGPKDEATENAHTKEHGGGLDLSLVGDLDTADDTDAALAAVAKVADEKMSARAMKFRAMITKFRPEKKAAAIKAFTPSREPMVDNLGRSFGLGRRKTSTARVWVSLSEGEGGIFRVNTKPMIEYFPRDHLQNEVLKPLEITEKLGWFHVHCTAKGGGQAGQAGAIRLGLARALEAHDPWLRKVLKKAGLMERDARKVERKKPGLKKARKAPQWVKR